MPGNLAKGVVIFSYESESFSKNLAEIEIAIKYINKFAL